MNIELLSKLSDADIDAQLKAHKDVPSIVSMLKGIKEDRAQAQKLALEELARSIRIQEAKDNTLGAVQELCKGLPTPETLAAAEIYNIYIPVVKVQVEALDKDKKPVLGEDGKPVMVDVWQFVPELNKAMQVINQPASRKKSSHAGMLYKIDTATKSLVEVGHFESAAKAAEHEGFTTGTGINSIRTFAGKPEYSWIPDVDKS